MEDVAKATLTRLVEIMQPMDGAKVLSVREDGFTLRLERVSDAIALARVGKQHAYVNDTPSDVEWSEDAYFQGVVAEDADFVYSGAGTLDYYDDDGCGGEFDVDVYVAPKEARAALVKKLVGALRDRGKTAQEEIAASRTLRMRIEMCPFSQKPRTTYYDPKGKMVYAPRSNDIVIDETKATKDRPAKATKAKPAKARQR